MIINVIQWIWRHLENKKNARDYCYGGEDLGNSVLQKV